MILNLDLCVCVEERRIICRRFGEVSEFVCHFLMLLLLLLMLMLMFGADRRNNRMVGFSESFLCQGARIHISSHVG